MSKSFLYFLGIVLMISIGAILNWSFCCTEKSDIEIALENQKMMTSKTGVEVRIPLIIRDLNGDFDFSTDDNFNFKRSKEEVLEPISLKVNKGVLQLVDYLSKQKSKNVNVTGYYQENEIYTGVFPDLGVARAASVKHYLVSRGMDKAQIHVFGKLQKRKEGMILSGLVTFQISGKEPIKKGEVIQKKETSNASDFLRIERKSIISNPLFCYFRTGKSTFKLNTDQRHKMKKIVDYIEKVKTAKVHIISHTDNVGIEAANMKLAKKRGVFVKEYLIKYGISNERIEIIPKGSSEPIESNRTELGRSKNRRTVITIN